jgi:hypothetical protein
MAIWKMNLDRTVKRKKGYMTVDEHEIMRFAENHFEYHKRRNTRWNGRQVRNAFQTAAAMAEFEALEKLESGSSQEDEAGLEQVTSHLKVSHFQTVADASSQFDAYMVETIGGTDSERALTDRERADNFKWASSSRPTHPYMDNTPAWLQPPQTNLYSGSNYSPHREPVQPMDSSGFGPQYHQDYGWQTPHVASRPSKAGPPGYVRHPSNPNDVPFQTPIQDARFVPNPSRGDDPVASLGGRPSPGIPSSRAPQSKQEMNQPRDLSFAGYDYED